MEPQVAASPAMQWGTRVATWGAVAIAATLTLAALIDWSLPGGWSAGAWTPTVITSVVFAAAVSSMQRRWTCVAAALGVFALGILVGGTGTEIRELSEWSSVIEPAALSIDASTVLGR